MTIRYEESVINQLRTMWKPLVADLRFRLTVGRLMIIVSAAGLCLAAYRLHISLGSFLFGVLSLALLRTFGKLDRAGGGGTPMRLSKMAGIFAGSMGIASAIIGASLLTLVGVYLVASGLNGWFLSLSFGVFAVSLVRMADILPRMRKEGTLGDRQIVPKAIIYSLKTPVMIGLALLFLVPAVCPFYFYGYHARATLYDASFFLSVVVAITIAGRMRRRFW